MKRFLVFGLVGISGAMTAGCPIYSDDDSDRYYGWGCGDSFDCPSGTICSEGYCVSGAGGGAGFVPARPPVSDDSGIDSGPEGAARGAGGAAYSEGGVRTGGAAGTGAVPDDDAGEAGMPLNAGGSSAVNAGGSSTAGQDGGLAATGGSGTPDASVPVSPDAAADAGVIPEDASLDVAPSTVYCGSPSDCPAGQTCDANGVCRIGDCGTYPCINQYVCSRTNDVLACTSADPSFCSADSQCDQGSRCVDGVCTKLADLCSDQSQCPGGHHCVDGKCVASCGSDAQCPSGFRCQSDLGICSLAAQACSKTSDCGSATLVCIQKACVSRCSARGACGDGAGVCVSNGCTPAQKTVHECDADGESTGCGAGRVCVHHHCYVSCEAPNETACAGLPKFTACKSVTAAGGTYSVCASAENLGNECDPTRDLWCTAEKTCIDGFCR